MLIIVIFTNQFSRITTFSGSAPTFSGLAAAFSDYSRRIFLKQRLLWINCCQFTMDFFRLLVSFAVQRRLPTLCQLSLVKRRLFGDFLQFVIVSNDFPGQDLTFFWISDDFSSLANFPAGTFPAHRRLFLDRRLLVLTRRRLRYTQRTLFPFRR